MKILDMCQHYAERITAAIELIAREHTRGADSFERTSNTVIAANNAAYSAHNSAERVHRLNAERVQYFKDGEDRFRRETAEYEMQMTELRLADLKEEIATKKGT